MNKQELLLTDEELDVLPQPIECDVGDKWEYVRWFLKVQLAKALPIIEKQERERIIKVLTKRGLFDDFLCSEEKALKNNCPTCKMFWQAMKGK